MFSDAVITMQLNSKQAEKDLQKLTQNFKDAGNAISNGFLAKLGGIGAGFLGLKGLKEVYTDMKKIVHLSELWELPIEKMHQYINMFQLFGGNVDDAAASIDRLESLQAALMTESSGELKELGAQLGLNLSRQDYLGAIELIRSRFNLLTTYGKKATLDALGNDENNALRRILEASPQDFAKTWETAGSFNLLSEKNKQDFIATERNIGKIKVAFESIGLTILQDVQPAVSKFAEMMANVAADPETVNRLIGLSEAFLKIKGSVLAAKVAFGLLRSPMMWLAGGFTVLYLKSDKFREIVGDTTDILGGFFTALVSGDWGSFWAKLDKTIDKYKGLKDAIEAVKNIFKTPGLAWDSLKVLTGEMSQEEYDQKNGAFADRFSKAIDKFGAWILSPLANFTGVGTKEFLPHYFPNEYPPSRVSNDNRASSTIYDNRTVNIYSPSQRQFNQALGFDRGLAQQAGGMRNGAF